MKMTQDTSVTRIWMEAMNQKDMTPEQRKTDTDESQGFVKEVAKGLVKEVGVTLKWGLWGALLGAIALGGIGFWKFGFTGLWVGALAGALVGGIGAIVLFTSA
jgi:hypothetical protein